MNNNETYILASNTYAAVIKSVVDEMGYLISGSVVAADTYFKKFINDNISKLESVGILIIDLNSFSSSDQETLEALKSIKIMGYTTRIIILAANRIKGDKFLTDLFHMGVYNLIVTDDFNKIREELRHCLQGEGKGYKDSICFEETKSSKELEKIVIEKEVKQTVNKVMIGMVGTQKRIGVTHNSIVLANFLRKEGYMVALVEANQTGAYEHIREVFEEKLYEDYFIYNGIDYYPNANDKTIGNVLGKSYNFIIVDFGDYNDADIISFNKSNVCIVISGSKPWEIEQADVVFKNASRDTIKGYYFCFNMVRKKEEKFIKNNMEGLDHVSFLSITEDPFTSFDFKDAKNILNEYMAIKANKNNKKKLFKERNGK